MIFNKTQSLGIFRFRGKCIIMPKMEQELKLACFEAFGNSLPVSSVVFLQIILKWKLKSKFVLLKKYAKFWAHDKSIRFLLFLKFIFRNKIHLNSLKKKKTGVWVKAFHISFTWQNISFLWFWWEHAGFLVNDDEKCMKKKMNNLIFKSQ